ncbi:N-myristoyl transferase [Pisolithus marmoratus]|nr:N-myristoyl transferase [Pisolithus marmoratus]
MSSTSPKATVQDTAEMKQGGEGGERTSGSEEERHFGPEDEDGVTETSQPSSSNRQRKKRSKVSKALNKIRGNEIPQSVVNHVVEQVKVEQGNDSPAADPDAVRVALEQLKIMDSPQGKGGCGWPGGKRPWVSTSLRKAIEDVRREPYPLPKDFEWSILDINDPKQIKEVYDLLSLNYPPGYFKEWHLGVRVSSNKKLVAFISGIPATLRVRGKSISCAFHKKLRSKRLAPVLIKEVTRQVHLQGIAQAIYTAGVVLPTPVSTCRQVNRRLSPATSSHSSTVKFTYVPRNMTLARMIRGLREMEEKDIPQVADLFARYMQRFSMAPIMTVDEIRHLFLSGRGDIEQPSEKYRRPKQVLWAYLVEDPKEHRITDFFSFYSLPSTIINHPRHNLLEAAYLFYYASDVAFEPGVDESDKLKTRLVHLIGDALIIANQAKFDVFNAVTLMDNVSFFDDLKFGAGDGLLNFYLYNWRTAPLAGVKAIGDVGAGRGVGVVML